MIFIALMPALVDAMVPTPADLSAVNDNSPWYDRTDCNYYAFTNKFPYGALTILDTDEDIEEELPDDIADEFHIPKDGDYPTKILPKTKSSPPPVGSKSYAGNGYRLFEGQVRLMPGGYTVYSEGLDVSSIISATNNAFGFEFMRDGGSISIPIGDDEADDFQLSPGMIIFKKGTSENCGDAQAGAVVAGCAAPSIREVDNIRTLMGGVAWIIIPSQATNLHELGHILNFDHLQSSSLMKPVNASATSWPAAEKEGLMKMYNAVEDGWFRYMSRKVKAIPKTYLCNRDYKF